MERNLRQASSSLVNQSYTPRQTRYSWELGLKSINSPLNRQQGHLRKLCYCGRPRKGNRRTYAEQDCKGNCSRRQTDGVLRNSEKGGKPQNYMQSYLRHLSDYDVITRVDRGVYKLVDNVVSQCIAKNSI